MLADPVASKPAEPTYFLTRWLFLRLLGLVYLAAFASLWVQIDGLIGRNGILPIADDLNLLRDYLGPERYRLLPTLFWFDAGDRALHWVAGGGTLLALLLVLDVAPGPILALLWGLYLSLVSAGNVFLGFQWDNLLLEAGLLAVLWAPYRLRPQWLNWARPESPPSQLGRWLLYWLLFRLMFSSGIVKLRSGDETWRMLTALTYHYETQPLPTWTSWYMHQLPLWFQRLSCLLMFVVELGLPALIFIPRPRSARALAVVGLVGLQLLIIPTGNYAFFNWLTIALCLLLLDDKVWARWWPHKWHIGPGYSSDATAAPRSPLALARQVPVALVAFVIVSVSALQFAGLFIRPLPLPDVARDALGWVLPFRSINSYGLFAVMTTTRPEIILEGSSDGETWLPYEFKWKPGDLAHRPRFVAPHQPRLDWQMWFAALGNYQSNPWLGNVMVRLLEGSPQVLALLATNPFPDDPPRFVRAVLYDYTFTDPQTRRASGDWWQRQPAGLYAPALSLP